MKSYLFSTSSLRPFGSTFDIPRDVNGPTSEGYRYGFNGQENDNQIKGVTGADQDHNFRSYDTRLGRYKSLDPLAKDYPFNSPYAFAENSPIAFIDLEGSERYYAADGSLIGQVGDNTEVRVVNDNFTKQQALTAIFKANGNNAPTTQQRYSSFLNAKSVSFTDYAENVNDVLNDAPLETWADNGENCYKAASAQMANAGQSMENKYSAIQADVDNAKQPANQQLSEDAVGAAIYTMTQLKNGNPVMVGVTETSTDGSTVDVNNYNQNTGHFVVISSMQKTGNNVTFGYYDNANGTTGKSSNNKFNVNTETGAATDNSNIGVGGVQSYKVSEVRKNK